MRKLTVAAVQMSCSVNPEESIKKAEDLVMEAVNKGAKLILLPELFAAMEKSNVKDLYYFNPKELRDQKELIDGKVVVKKETSPEYQWILDKLDKILPAYEGLNNPTIKRLYVPTVLVIKEGKILNHHFDTLPEQKDPQIPLTTEQKIKLQTILQEAISPLSNTTCSIPSE